MDSNKILIGFVVLVVGFFAFPIVAKKMKEQQATGTTGGTPVQAVSTGTAEKQSYPELNEPPLLNDQNLVGTEWQVQVENYKVKVTIAAGGVAYATHPMAKALTGMDYVEGRWRVEYNKMFVNASIGGNDLSIELRISGSRLYALEKKGKPTEVKRF